MTKSWGPCTWYLFHTLAEKMIEDQFITQKSRLLQIIKSICYNLPCPDCALHAKTKINTLNESSINSKKDLKLMLLSFHNEVNVRLGKPIFTENELYEKYKSANTTLIIQYFLQNWSKKTHNPKLMSEELHKSRVVNNFMEWWKNNYSSYYT